MCYNQSSRGISQMQMVIIILCSLEKISKFYSLVRSLFTVMIFKTLLKFSENESVLNLPG